MATQTRSGKRKRPTFIEEARREQIIEATIDTVAEIGLARASLAEIAKEADISKAVIPYYFGSKDELIEQTLRAVYERSDTYIANRVDDQETALDKLRAHVSAQLGFARDHRREAVADWELISSFDSPEAKRRFNSTTYDPIRRRMGRILSQGQESGEFRDFPVNAVAATIVGVLDGIILQWTWAEDAVDLDACCQEVLGMVEPYVRNPSDSAPDSQVGR
ncbi:TetR/AcrR family transcriptional regulator [Chloroflexota bacterium]